MKAKKHQAFTDQIANDDCFSGIVKRVKSTRFRRNAFSSPLPRDEFPQA